METKQALSQLTEEIFNVVKEKVDETNTDLTTHINNKNNPHQVNKTQLGLGNVDNTSDANKPISTATQNALNLKEDESNKVSSFQATPDNTHYPSEKLVKDNLDTINSKIPSEASSTNQLADKQWVNDNGGKIDTASIDGDNLQVTNKNLEIPTVRTDTNNQGLTSTQKTNAKTNLDLNNVTNDKQVKGLSSGTTEDHIVVFGNDGYSVKDSGKTFTTSIRDISNATDTVIPTEKATRTALDLKVDKSDIGYLSISGQSGTFDAYDFSEITKKYCVIYKSDTKEYFYKLSWQSNPVKYVFTNINISGGNTVNMSNKYIEVYPSYNPVQWMYVSSSYNVYSSSYVDTLLANKVDKSQIGYFELSDDSETLTDAQYVEAQKPYCIIKYGTIFLYKMVEGTKAMNFYRFNLGTGTESNYSLLQKRILITKSTKEWTLTDINEDIYTSSEVDVIVSNFLHSFNVCTVQSSTTASKEYSVGDLLIYNGTLYKVTTAIAQGGTIVTSGVNANVESTTIEELMNNLGVQVIKGFSNNWSTKTWNGFSEVEGYYIWSDGTNTYYSNDSDQYVLQGDTWVQKVWNPTVLVKVPQYGYNIWTDGLNWYYSGGNNTKQYKLTEDGYWVSYSWNYTGFSGEHIWTDGDRIFISRGTTTGQKILNRSTNSWENVTWNNLSFNLDAETIWTDDEDMYITIDQNESYKLDKGTFNWTSVTITNTPANFYANEVWSDGENTYYDCDTEGEVAHLIWNKSTLTWEAHSWIGIPSGIWGSEIWKLNNQIYSSYNAEQYVLDKATHRALVLEKVAETGSYSDLKDKPNFYDKSQTNALLNNKEDKSNKVTSVSSSSTDTQYPSAQCLYDNLDNYSSLNITQQDVLDSFSEAEENYTTNPSVSNGVLSLSNCTVENGVLIISDKQAFIIDDTTMVLNQ